MAPGLAPLGALCTAGTGGGGLAGGHNLSKPTPGGSKPPLAPLMPPLEGNSCWLWEAVDLFKLEGKQRQGSLGRRGGSGAGEGGVDGVSRGQVVAEDWEANLARHPVGAVLS